MITYKELLTKSTNAVTKLQGLNVLPKDITGRYKYYHDLIRKLDYAYSNNEMMEFLKNNNYGETGFALKELSELAYIFEHIFRAYSFMDTTSRDLLVEKTKVILRGPAFTAQETPNNSVARNYQFELRVLAKLVETGYKDIKLRENPDIKVTIDKRAYDFECKRILSASDKALIYNANTAINQLRDNMGNSHVGIVALDVSPKYEDGKNWLNSPSRQKADSYVLDQLEKKAFTLYGRLQKIQEAGRKNNVIAILLNISSVYKLKNNELGWINELGILVLDKENPNSAKMFLSDFDSLKNSKVIVD